MNDATYWLHNNGEVKQTDACPGSSVWCKPRRVVVLDPEDREQVERLAGALDDEFARQWPDIYAASTEVPAVEDTDVTQAALRSLIKPPRPLEVFAHLLLIPDQLGDLRTAKCGKVWKIGQDVTVVGRCPECVEIVAGMWIA